MGQETTVMTNTLSVNTLRKVGVSVGYEDGCIMSNEDRLLDVMGRCENY